MRKYLYIFLILALAQAAVGQNNQSWKGYFSFNEIKDVSQSPNVFYAAAENALFSKNLGTNTLKTTNTVDGLSGQTITALYHSPTLNKTMVGYENGLIIIINEADGSMLNVVDIINKQLPNNMKRVNHFMEHNGIVYISCDFGIVQYNLMTNGFGDTYFIGDGGAEIKIYQTAVFGDHIYAASVDGIRRALVADPNLIDFAQWTEIATGIWTGITTVVGELAAVTSTGQLNRLNGATFSPFGQLPEPAVDIRTSEDKLIVATSDKVYIYNSNLGPAGQVDSNLIPGMNAVFTAATIIGDTIFMGTFENGVVTAPLSNTMAFDFISPDGPSRNNIFSINTESSNLWAVYGDYTPIEYNPDPLRYYGISKYNDSGWLNIPYEEVHEPGKEANDLVRVTVNPSNPENIFVSSYHSGLLEFENDVLVTQYDQTNSGLESLNDPGAPWYISVRIEQSAFDKNGNLWMTNGLLPDALKVLRTDGQWQSYDMTGILDAFFNTRFGKMVIDKNSTKWMATTSDGVVAFNETSGIFKKITFGPNGNLPVADVRALAVDNRNQLWIGTRRGLRVLSSVDRYLNEGQMTANPIIILEDDVAQELLFEQFITDIAVDGANNKWIATTDSGVFLLSPNGQETIHRFTSTNSPLPSNAVNDIGINSVTGEVFFATSKGMVSFKGIATGASDNLNNVVVYPNPVRPEFSGTVKISGLLDKANIKIADIEGNLVYEVVSEGGTIEWDTSAFGKYRVASGVYMIFISSEDGTETKVKKVMIVR